MLLNLLRFHSLTLQAQKERKAGFIIPFFIAPNFVLSLAEKVL